MPQEAHVRPAAPTLRTAPSVEELRRKRVLRCRLCSLPATVFAATVLLIVLIGVGALHDLMVNPSNADKHAIMLKLTFATGLVATCCLLAGIARRWSKHPLSPRNEPDAITKIVGELYLKHHDDSEVQSVLARYHSEVLAMDRDFTRYDVATMTAYCDAMESWHAPVKNSESEPPLQKDREHLHVKTPQTARRMSMRAGRR